MVSKITRIICLAFLLAGFAGSASALQYAELTLNDCDLMGCEGSTLFLSVQEDNGGWIVTYTINTDNYTGSLDGFNQIGFKAIADWTSGSLVSVPTGSYAINEPGYGPDPWEPVFEAPINSGSLCENINGNTSKVCIAGFVDISGGGDYTWVFRLEGGTLLDVEDWHLGAQYAGGPWRSNGHIISAEAAPIPEPTAAVLFGLGAILVTRRLRRR